MNCLPFGSAIYRQFQNTFLASVMVGLSYPKVKEDNSHKEKWGNYTRALFSVEPIEGIFTGPIVINRSDKKLVYIFDTDQAQVLISGDGYQSFADSVIPHAYKLKQFVIDVAGCNHPSQISIRKIDIFQIETEKGMAIDEGAVRRHFFSTNYVSYHDQIAELDEEEQKVSGMLKHQWSENDYLFTMRSAFVKVPKTENVYRLILDIDERYTPKEGINFEKLDEELRKMNMDLFNAFIWCVSDNVISIMEKGKE